MIRRPGHPGYYFTPSNLSGGVNAKQFPMATTRQKEQFYLERFRKDANSSTTKILLFDYRRKFRLSLLGVIFFSFSHCSTCSVSIFDAFLSESYCYLELKLKIFYL